MTSLGDTKLRNVGNYIGANTSVASVWRGMSRVWNSYRAKYVTCKNARMTPFWHAVMLAVAVNYAIDYSHLKAHSLQRKYH